LHVAAVDRTGPVLTRTRRERQVHARRRGEFAPGHGRAARAGPGDRHDRLALPRSRAHRGRHRHRGR